MTISGAVLTGGRSRRMGVDKALLDIDGVPMAERVAVALAAGGCSTVVFVGGDEQGLRRLGRPWIADRAPGEGPLGGVITALRHGRGDVLVAACDLADLDGATVALVIGAATDTAADVIVARTERIEPMLALWRAGTLPLLSARFAAGERALHRVLDGLAVTEVDVSPARLRNVNEPADVERGAP